MANEPGATYVPPVGSVIAVALFARLEQDQTYTLILDDPAGDALPIEMAQGFVSIADILTVVRDALTAPAVTEDRMVVLEEAVQPVQQLIDVTNEHDQTLAGMETRMQWLEATVADLANRGGMLAPAAPGRIQPAGRRTQPQDLRGRPTMMMPAAASATRAAGHVPIQSPIPQPPPLPRAQQGPSRRPAMDIPRPSFERGTFQPHQPVGRVSRGPGSPQGASEGEGEENP